MSVNKLKLERTSARASDSSSIDKSITSPSLYAVELFSGLELYGFDEIDDDGRGDDGGKECLEPDSEFTDIEVGSLDDIVLPMPSAYPNEVQEHSLFKTFIAAERNIWEGKANDVLWQLRTKLTCRSYMNKQKKNFVGQKDGTRNKKVIERSDMTIKALQNEYNAIFETMCTLDPNLDQNKYKRVEDLDIVPFNLYDLKLNQKKTRIPWIWQSYQEILHTDKQIESWSQESK